MQIHQRKRGRKRIKDIIERKKKITELKEDKKEKGKEKENVNTFQELNDCYNRLNDLISNYSFSDITDAVIKLNNNIPAEESDPNEKQLFRDIKKITSVIYKKEDIIMMCLSILSSKNPQIEKETQIEEEETQNVENTQNKANSNDNDEIDISIDEKDPISQGKEKKHREKKEKKEPENKNEENIEEKNPKMKETKLIKEKEERIDIDLLLFLS